MTVFYLYDNTTMKAAGVYEGDTVPSGYSDAGVPYDDGRMEWDGVSAWFLPDADKADDERAWRDDELLDTDLYGLSDRTMSAAMTTYRQDLRDMPAQAGFPNTHTRPTRPAGE